VAGGGISRAHRPNLRTGDRYNPTLQHLAALSRFFGVSAA
jgi:hypothetical protein